MSNFENALFDAAQWLNIPGVEDIIPNQTDNSIMVLISCPVSMVNGIIPEHFQGFMVNFYYVRGLNVNSKDKPGDFRS